MNQQFAVPLGRSLMSIGARSTLTQLLLVLDFCSLPLLRLWQKKMSLLAIVALVLLLSRRCGASAKHEQQLRRAVQSVN